MVIDFHSHYPDEPDFAERLIDLLPTAGIDRVCLCSAGAAFGRASNETILNAAQKYPGQITAFALVELGTDSPEVVDEYAARGYGGYKITNPLGPYDAESFFPLYERMERSGLPLLAPAGILMRIRMEPGRRVNSKRMRPICLDPGVACVSWAEYRRCTHGRAVA